MNHKKQYDMQQQRQAMTRLMFRVLVAGYIGYLGIKVLLGTLNGESPVPAFVAVLIALVFVGAAAVFCVYGYKQYRKALQAAEIHEETPDESADESADAEGMSEAPAEAEDATPAEGVSKAPAVAEDATRANGASAETPTETETKPPQPTQA